MSRSIKVYTDASTVADIRQYASTGWISGFTTNPTLIRKGGATDYRQFAMAAIEAAGDLPLSLEVVADDVDGMYRQAKFIGTWGSNVNVKIPIMTTAGDSCVPLVRRLLDEGIKVNVTAIMTDAQVRELADALTPTDPVIVSVFAGRIADAGHDPVPIMRRYRDWLTHLDGAELLWASPREVLNVIHAEQSGCHIITATPEILAKTKFFGKDLHEFSRETVQMFVNDAAGAGFEIFTE